LFPALRLNLLNGFEVQRFAVERDALEIDANDAASAAADVDLAVYDGRRALQVHELARHRQFPQWQALVDGEAVQRSAVGLVHAVAEDETALENARRADRRQLQVGRRFAPEDPFLGSGLGADAGEVGEI